MHFHAEHSLFFERQQPLWRSICSLGLAVFMAVANVTANRLEVSLAGAGLASLLLVIAYGRGRRRVEPAVVWVLALVVIAMLGGNLIGGGPGGLGPVAARVSCGVLWVLWLGTVLDWPALRDLLTVARVPASVVGSLDHAVMSGAFTKHEWSRRGDAARMRLGAARVPLRARAHLLGEGALAGFLRLESAEEQALSRSAFSHTAAAREPLRLESVGVVRGGEIVIRSMDLTLHTGEWALVCGPSGAGKSSLLRVLAGLDAPGSGRVARLGTQLTSDLPLRKRLDGRVGLLSQNPEHHFIASTVSEDIAWGLVQRGLERGEAGRRAAEMADALGVGELLRRPCHALSFGEQRRVALAGLLVTEPDLLLLDEPTSGLDPVAAEQLIELVQVHAEKSGAACLWATHDLHSLPSRVQRVVLLHGGTVVFDGDLHEGLSAPWLKRAGLARSLGTEGDS